MKNFLEWFYKQPPFKAAFCGITIILGFVALTVLYLSGLGHFIGWAVTDSEYPVTVFLVSLFVGLIPPVGIIFGLKDSAEEAIKHIDQ